MAEFQLTVTAEERQYLLDHLAQTLKETRVEEHRTRTPSYREHVLHQEDLIQGLLNNAATSDSDENPPSLPAQFARTSPTYAAARSAGTAAPMSVLVQRGSLGDSTSSTHATRAIRFRMSKV